MKRGLMMEVWREELATWYSHSLGEIQQRKLQLHVRILYKDTYRRVGGPPTETMLKLKTSKYSNKLTNCAGTDGCGGIVSGGRLPSNTNVAGETQVVATGVLPGAYESPTDRLSLSLARRIMATGLAAAAGGGGARSFIIRHRPAAQLPHLEFLFANKTKEVGRHHTPAPLARPEPSCVWKNAEKSLKGRIHGDQTVVNKFFAIRCVRVVATAPGRVLLPPRRGFIIDLDAVGSPLPSRAALSSLVFDARRPRQTNTRDTRYIGAHRAPRRPAVTPIKLIHAIASRPMRGMSHKFVPARRRRPT
ncbi:hypothetical protein EVAR_65323_1 [Eumeta japonica]|uniref:Uncharacterized protein n=1 Tax=Eumeta variegata TaxID=151549 RepID=A0A4C1YV23_EUMVA|nr:hypothetical protein EVAR_65323_1 [Eumeta japonica]